VDPIDAAVGDVRLDGADGGITLGRGGATKELGWGGYWAWDPVENASIMPWRGGDGVSALGDAARTPQMFKIWNFALVGAGVF